MSIKSRLFVEHTLKRIERINALDNGKETILLIAKTLSSIIPDFLGVTLGGSRAFGVDDSLSDVEMYFYTKNSVPKLEDIDAVLAGLGAQHKRCDSFLWNEKPWGPHSFFVYDGLYFEVGYRKIDEIRTKIGNYLDGNVEPERDCHDLGLGYMYSGLAASVIEEPIIYSQGTEISELKNYAKDFSDKLLNALKEEYLETAYNLLEGKMYNATKRNDYIQYSTLSTRVIRALIIMAFAINKKHFPGDKWNKTLLLRTEWKKKEYFVKLLEEYATIPSIGCENLSKKRDFLIKAYKILEDEIPCQKRF